MLGLSAGSGAFAQSLTSQQLYAVAIGLDAGDTASKIVLGLNVTASGTAPTLARFGLYDSGLANLLASTADTSADAQWSASSQSFISFSFTTPYAVTATGLYYVAALVNGTWSVTQPTILAQGDFNASFGVALVAGASPRTQGKSGVTDLPASWANAGGRRFIWAGIA